MLVWLLVVLVVLIVVVIIIIIVVVMLQHEVDVRTLVQGRLEEQMAVRPLVVPVVELTDDPQVIPLLVVGGEEGQTTVGEVVASPHVELVRVLPILVGVCGGDDALDDDAC